MILVTAIVGQFVAALTRLTYIHVNLIVTDCGMDFTLAFFVSSSPPINPVLDRDKSS